MKLIKFSTLIIKITHKNAVSVSYTDYTDIKCRLIKHFFPEDSAFPYKLLNVGDTYTLISVQVHVEESERPLWYFWKAFPMGDIETHDTLKDALIEQFITDAALVA